MCRNLRLPTDHPSSSYGRPVIVLADGSALDLSAWLLLDYRVERATHEELDLLQRSPLFGQGVSVTDIGRKGGQSTSDAKTAAARANGKRGGRSRKQT